jgi:type II secretory pathway component GspD/PulD (secretin)
MRATTYLWLVLWCGLAIGQGSLEVIDLRHRTAEQVLPALRPLLEPGGVLTGQRSQLIVRTSARNLAEIRRALDALDTPARRLVISVRFDDAAVASRDSIETRGRISNRGSEIDARVTGSRASSEERVDQRVQVLEGGRAVLATGTSRPLAQRDGVVIQDIATGFDVVPRVSGNIVFLDIEPRRAAAGTVTHGSVQNQRAASSVSARLGEWFELAGTSGASARDERGILSGSRQSASGNRRIWVRVDEVLP